MRCGMVSTRSSAMGTCFTELLRSGTATSLGLDLHRPTSYGLDTRRSSTLKHPQYKRQ